MTRLWTVALLAVASTAFGATPEEGQALFNASCSQCHTATQPLPTADGKGKPAPATTRTRWAGPDLIKVFGTQSNAKLRTWMAGPTRQRPNTSCRIFPMRAGEVDAVIAFLVTTSQPPALTAKAARNQNLKRGLERAKQQKASETRRQK